jgi:hypothetical protein
MEKDVAHRGFLTGHHIGKIPSLHKGSQWSSTRGCELIMSEIYDIQVLY